MNISDYNQNKMKITLRGKVAIVTGGATSIGLGIIRALSQARADVALLDVDESKGRKAEEEMQGKCRFFKCDVSFGRQVKETINTVNKQLNGIDILVNNAGIIRRKTVVELDEDEWDLVMGVNLKGVYLLSKYAIPHMAEKGGGSIVNISSGWGIKGGPKAASYCASKGGVVNLTRAMAIDHGKQGIRVNSICPGDTDTQLLRDEARQLGEDEKEFLQSAADRPIKRIGTPQDIANAVLYLVSDLSSWVTGANLVVDGGGLA